MSRRPRIYKAWYGTLPWRFQAGIEIFSFHTWEEAVHFASWYTLPEPTA